MKRLPSFKPRHFTIEELRDQGWDIASVHQENRWAVITTGGQMMDTPNENGDHVAISPVRIKISMDPVGAV